MFRFRSTTLHVVVNVTSTPYFNTDVLRTLHERVKNISQLRPVDAITYDNVLDSDDDNVPGHRSGLNARMVTDVQSGGQTRHGNVYQHIGCVEIATQELN